MAARCLRVRRVAWGSAAGQVNCGDSSGAGWLGFGAPFEQRRAVADASHCWLAGGCDNGVKMWNLQTNQQQQVAQHAAPVRHAFFIRQVGPAPLAEY